MNEDYKKVIEYFEDKFTLKDLLNKGFSKLQAENVINSMLENGMIWEDNQIPALPGSSASKNIYENPKTVLYWIICKATDEQDFKENLENIKNNEVEDDEGEGDSD